VGVRDMEMEGICRLRRAIMGGGSRISRRGGTLRVCLHVYYRCLWSFYAGGGWSMCILDRMCAVSDGCDRRGCRYGAHVADGRTDSPTLNQQQQPQSGISSYIPAGAQGYANTASSYANAGVSRARDGLDSVFTQQNRDKVRDVAMHLPRDSVDIGSDGRVMVEGRCVVCCTRLWEWACGHECDSPNVHPHQCECKLTCTGGRRHDERRCDGR
jgi:hypothetical protein